MRRSPLPTPPQIDRRLRQMLAADSAHTGDTGDTARLMMMLTRSCELRCSYCFVQVQEESYGQPHPGAPHTASGAPPSGDLSPATARRAIDLWMTSERSKLGLQLFGGEPTRRWDTLTDVLHYATGHPLRAGRPLELQLTTNGLGLSDADGPARLQLLAEHGVVVQLSLDGAGADNRFRRPLDLSREEADRRWGACVGALRASGVRWFMNVTVPPTAAVELVERLHAARAWGAPGLQLNYATGMRWTSEQSMAWLAGMREVLEADHRSPSETRLYNWHNAADPAPLCGDAIVDVDGSVLQVGGIFHERRFPALRAAYLHGHVSTLRSFAHARVPLGELWARTRTALSADHAAAFLDGMRLGAGQDLVCRVVAAELARDRRTGTLDTG